MAARSLRPALHDSLHVLMGKPAGLAGAQPSNAALEVGSV